MADNRPAWIALPVLLVIAVATVVLGHSLETDKEAEQARQQHFMRSASAAVVDDLGAELFAMYSAFSYDLYARKDAGESITQRELDLAISRYRAQARFPDLLTSVVALISQGDGTYRCDTWGSTGWITDRRPDWADALDAPKSPANFSLERPVLTLYLKGKKPVKGEVNSVALRFSTQVVLGSIVPTLVKQHFAEGAEAPNYITAVRNLDVASADHNSPTDWQLALLPWTAFDTWFDYYLVRQKNLEASRMAYPRAERQASVLGPGSGTGWALSVRRSPAGLVAEMDAIEWRNRGLCAAFFGILVLGLFGLYWAARRSQQLAQQERTFLALISHELKTPLAVVKSLSDNLAQGLTTDPGRVREYGQVLQEESDRLGRMISNVLGLTAMQGGVSSRERLPIDLTTLVRDRVDREPPRDDLELLVSIQPGLAPVQGLPTALSAAVDNLIGNAFRHGTQGPGPHRISIRLEPRRRWGRRGVELRVEDNGPGFRQADARRYLKPFRRGRTAEDQQTPGGGVGLSLVQTTARALGGRLQAMGRPGKGATFVLWLREVSS